MAAGELRDAIHAAQRGDTATATAALMSIDPESWHAIETRLNSLGGSIAELFPQPDPPNG
ncbi:hypothetical protein RM780_09475 [Streptomyces sp. DSM 44917]|uniref:Uncharacterized protein n=1 Tax=Streptomyces boetiae TaxID=3075541 RepID=A0ABU2L6J7_9ACTN|nr:hypothetical protein [Streptomyces sp. DSM 44917]MDT0307191.1 hypothetical protein [Streptomyces sp. DSM 44917]